MEKQTALQKFIEAISNSGIVIINQTLIDNCLEMEKEQLCYFYVKGAEAEINNPYVTNIEFYNKTFKSE